MARIDPAGPCATRGQPGTLYGLLLAVCLAACADAQFRTDAGRDERGELDGGRDASVMDAGAQPADGGSTSDAELNSVRDAASDEDAAATASPDAGPEAAQDAGITVVSLTAGANTTCAVLSSGRVKCWGYNNCGQVGDRTYAGRNRPTEVMGLDEVESVAIGYRHSCALLRDGTVKCWGCNDYGQLGNDSTSDSLVPVPVQDIAHVVQLGASDKKTCALSDVGTVSCWGNLGGATPQLVPRQLPGLTKITEIGISIVQGGCARSSSGAVSCWNDDGSPPVEVPGVTGAVSVSSGYEHACAALSTGSVKCWNRIGADGGVPAVLDASAVRGAISVGAGATASCARLGDGGVHCWGDNAEGELGTGRNGAAAVIPGLDVSLLSVGGYSSCALTKTGSVRCWGENAEGQIGDGAPIGNHDYDRFTPVIVPGLP